ncbi:helix-turn-helix transcriptional regulator [Actinocorallia sp. API 0066]|uniref:helix-turn-helix transcriptional regulator n=1 Tax=Actinocorallia sp. API 0066 TaxID=2896846 RepID=UPI001E2BFB09|nr:helix-turn-helix transcriptional regulator [Actinocorallia sp. API 0066]MCD0449884.1 helix-turn-helix transcriptional regulator [Actinocorallia sp. API 0066]
MEQLGDFLKSRRARITPEEAGLVNYGGRRRVPGLRREELAQLAGVSIAYLTRLEQGHSQNASDAVLDALSSALRLDEGERDHLFNLAKAGRRRKRRRKCEQASPMVRRLIDAMADIPVVVLGGRTDVLAWNTLGHAFFAGHLDPESPYRPDERPHMARLIFLDPHTRDLYADGWEGKARECVRSLRYAAGRDGDDPALASLIGELSVHSAEFTRLWAAHEVRDCGGVERVYRHPLVGEVTLAQEVAALDTVAVERLALYHAEPGSPSAAALSLLRQLAEGGGRAREGAGPHSRQRTV